MIGVWSFMNKLMISHATSFSYYLVSELVFSISKLIHRVWFIVANVTVTSYCENMMNSNAKATNPGMKSITKALNSTAKLCKHLITCSSNSNDTHCQC